MTIGLFIILVIHVLIISFNCLSWMSSGTGETLSDFSCGTHPSAGVVGVVAFHLSNKVVTAES